MAVFLCMEDKAPACFSLSVFREKGKAICEKKTRLIQDKDETFASATQEIVLLFQGTAILLKGRLGCSLCKNSIH